MPPWWQPSAAFPRRRESCSPSSEQTPPVCAHPLDPLFAPGVKETGIAADKRIGAVCRCYWATRDRSRSGEYPATVPRRHRIWRRTASGAPSRLGVVRISHALRQKVCYTMTFLLFLISLAVLEYIVRRPEPTPKTGWQPLAKRRAEDPPADSAPALTPGLLALGQALDRWGRGQTPGATAKTPEVPNPQADRV